MLSLADGVFWSVFPFSQRTRGWAKTLLAVVVSLAWVRVSGQTILTEPPALSFGTLGDSVTLAVVASGPGLTYQWRKFGSPIPGATAANLTLGELSITDAGLYDVVVASGTSAITSRAARLELRPAVFPEAVAFSRWVLSTCPPAHVMRHCS